MAVTIRLRRAGSKKNAFYHVVASDSHTPRDGRFIERLGHYDPRQKPSLFVVNRERLERWRQRGAKISRTVAQMLAKQNRQAEQAHGEG